MLLVTIIWCISLPKCFRSNSVSYESGKDTRRGGTWLPSSSHAQGAGVSGERFRVQGSGFRVQGAGVWVQSSGFRVQGSGFRVQGSGCRVQGAGFRLQGPGFRVHATKVEARQLCSPQRVNLWEWMKTQKVTGDLAPRISGGHVTNLGTS